LTRRQISLLLISDNEDKLNLFGAFAFARANAMFCSIADSIAEGVRRDRMIPNTFVILSHG
jgi:hypothetical protein